MSDSDRIADLSHQVASQLYESRLYESISSDRIEDLSHQVASLGRHIGRLYESISKQNDTIDDLRTQLERKKRWGWNQHLDDDHWNYGDSEADKEGDECATGSTTMRGATLTTKSCDDEWNAEGDYMHESGDPWEDKQWNQTLMSLLNQPRGRTECGVALLGIRKLVSMLQSVEPGLLEDTADFMRRLAPLHGNKRPHVEAMADEQEGSGSQAALLKRQRRGRSGPAGAGQA